MSRNNIVTLRKFFSTPEKPMTPLEMDRFWQSLNYWEKQYYRRVDLETGISRD